MFENYLLQVNFICTYIKTNNNESSEKQMLISFNKSIQIGQNDIASIIKSDF